MTLTRKWYGPERAVEGDGAEEAVHKRVRIDMVYYFVHKKVRISYGVSMGLFNNVTEVDGASNDGIPGRGRCQKSLSLRAV